MASNSKYNCIEKYSKNDSWNFKEYTNECVIWKGTDNVNYFSFNQNGQFKRIKNSAVAFSGTWVCDGDSNFILTTTDGVYYSSDGFKKRDNTSQPTPTTGIDPKLSCVKRHYDNKGREVTINSNGSLVIGTQTPSKVWVFSKNYYWTQYNTELKKKEFEGKWECTGDSSFRIISNDNQEWLSSDSIGWTDIAEPTTEPTTDPSTGGGFTWKDVNLTIDDLKSGKTVSMGMRGSIVGEIQKFLIGKVYRDVSKSGEPDNMFGSMTKAQVKKFQSENRDDKGDQLKKDGIVGPKTINALLKVPTPNTKGLERAVKSYLPTGVSSEL
jgi:hypothetical protein